MGKSELTQTELDNLVAATGDSAAKVRKSYEKEQKIFPADGMTQAQFEKMLGMSKSNDKKCKIDVGKTLFDLIDRDKSGHISLYEYMLAEAAVLNDNPEIIFKCLFKLCDTDHDDLLTKAELADLFVILLELENKNDKQKDMDDINKLVTKVFGDKEKLSESEFREVFTTNEGVKAIAQGLQLMMALGFSIAPQFTKYGTE